MNDVLEKSNSVTRVNNRELSGDLTYSNYGFDNDIAMLLLLYHKNLADKYEKLANKRKVWESDEDLINSEKEIDFHEKESRRQNIIQRSSQYQNVFLLTNIDLIYDKLSEIEFEEVLLEETFNSLVIKFKFQQKIFLVLNLPIDNNSVNIHDVVFSIVEKGKLIVSNIKTIDEIISGIKSYLNDTEIPSLSHS